MKNALHRLFWATFLIGTVALGGCGDDAGVTGTANDDISGAATLADADLDAEYGDLAYSDEAEAFGDTELLAAAMIDDAELAVDDEDSLTDEDPTLADPQMRRTYVRILWGQLDGDFDPERTDTEAYVRTDWSGDVKVSDGAVFLKRTILFERPFDHRLPRASRDSLAWVSHTGPHFDGILICVLSRVVDGVPQGELSFETGPFTTTIPVAELDGLDRHVIVDDLGNAVAMLGRAQDQQVCGKGFLGGFWRAGEDRPETAAIEMGGFRGRFMGQNGGVRGFLAGVYGLNSAGERVLVGKYIGRDGRVRGLIRGTWEPAADAEGMGSFQARWVNRNGAHLGVLMGRYLSHEADSMRPGDGFFEGVWEEICSSVDGDA